MPNRRIIAVACAVLTGCMLSGVVRARAQAALVVLAAQGERNVETEVAQAVRRALQARPELSLLDRATTASRARGGAELPRVEEPDFAALQRESAELLDAVAFGRDEETLARAQRTLERERDRLASVGRSDAAARALSEICLFMVRALHHRGEPARASAQARECWRLIPDLSAPASLHPPEVRSVVAHARAEGALARVHLSARANEPSGCTLRVQGRPLGALPVRLELVPGRYAFQVDCRRPGLVHSRTVDGGAELQLQLAVRLEQQLLWDRGELAIAVEHAASGTRARLAQLAERLNVAELWTLQVQDGTARLRRFTVRSSRAVPIAERAIALEPAGELAARVDEHVAELACAPACPSVARDRTEAALPAVGYVAAGLGAAALSASWLLFARYAALDGDLDELAYDTPGYARDLHARDAASAAALTTSAAGSALLAGSAPWWLPRAHGVPWLAWVAGGAGTLGLGVGVALWTEHGELYETTCPPSEVCSRRRSRVPLAPMLVMQGASLLAIPLTYALRAPEDSAALSLRGSSSRLELVCSGRFGTF